ncbi:hypothetical protein [Demequina rhizosphaerae]|uniref:hypothetical protein n=1 Tax=Demequina rhizosphaerae TaxID=1638985 RepID=UPI000785645F|nr:hypothetical protein [Demequina rhizosphaerae]
MMMWAQAADPFAADAISVDGAELAEDEVGQRTAWIERFYAATTGEAGVASAEVRVWVRWRTVAATIQASRAGDPRSVPSVAVLVTRRFRRHAGSFSEQLASFGAAHELAFTDDALVAAAQRLHEKSQYRWFGRWPKP